MIKKKFVAMSVAIALGGVGLGSGLASASRDPHATNAPSKPSSARLTTIPKIKTGGKMAAVYSPFDGLLAKKNVAEVANPFPGLFCFKPTSAVRSFDKRIVSVQVEWDHSVGFDLAAFWSQTAYECPAGYPVGIRTYKSAIASQQVAFSFVVQ